MLHGNNLHSCLNEQIENRLSMKKITIFLTVVLFVILLQGCYDREIIDRKEFYYELPTVQNLSYTVTGDEVTLTWQIPATIPDEFNRPLEVIVQEVENDIYRERRELLNENTTASFSMEPGNEYRFIVRLQGFLTPEARLEGFTDRVLSDGVIIEIE